MDDFLTVVYELRWHLLGFAVVMTVALRVSR